MTYLIFIIQFLTGALLLGCGLFYIVCIWATLTFFKPWQRREKIAGSRVDEESTTSVSVSLMVPICGLDDRARRNWEAFCQQIDCGPYEVLFGVADPNDPAIPLLQAIQSAYPDRVRLLIDLPPRGANYKDSTLSYLLEICQYEWLIFADSDIWVKPHYLRDVMSPLVKGQADLMTCAFIARNPRQLGGAIASLNRCCDFVPSALIARHLDGGLRFAIGMTIALHQETLKKAGGLHLDRIGSDYNLGKRVAQTGAKVELLSDILESNTDGENLRQIYHRELRWSRTIRFNRGSIYYTIMFCFGTVYALIFFSLSLRYREIPLWIPIASITLIGLRYIQATIACWSMGAMPLIRWFAWIPLRDGLSFLVWLMGCWGNQVIWRQRVLQIKPDGLIREVP